MPRDQDKVADISVEVCHLYGDELELDRIVDGLRLAKPIVDSIRQACPSLSLSICMLIDDYFGNLRVDPEDLHDRVRQAAVKADLAVNYLVSEAKLAETVRCLTDNLRPIPYPGAGSLVAERPIGSYLSSTLGSQLTNRGERDLSGFPESVRNFVHDRDVTKPSESGLKHRARRGEHDLDLLVELWSADPSNSANKYSCAVLAAWWQLARLGWWRGGGVGSVLPGVDSLDGSIPFAARRTISILDPAYIEIEHAVRTILEDFVVSGRVKAESEAFDDNVLGKVAYCFVDERFWGPRK